MHIWLRQILEKYTKLSDEEWNYLLTFAKSTKLQTKDIFIKSNCITNKVGFLKSGVLRAFQLNEKKEIVTSYFYHLPANSIVTLTTSYTLELPSEYSIEAITDCEIVYFDRSDIDKCRAKYKVFEKLISAIAVQQYITSSKRISDFQTKSAKSLYQNFVKESGDLLLQVPQHMIASYLGMSQYTLSKIKKQ